MWIEILLVLCLTGVGGSVTPHAGVWIEIEDPLKAFIMFWVTPHAGVWIEIPSSLDASRVSARHPPRGGVD